MEKEENLTSDPAALPHTLSPHLPENMKKLSAINNSALADSALQNENAAAGTSSPSGSNNISSIGP